MRNSHKLRSKDDDMYNMNIYEFCGLEYDPLYQRLQQVDSEHCIQLGNCIVSVDKFYEIQCEEFHELFHDKSDCYNFLNKMIVEGIIEI